MKKKVCIFVAFDNNNKQYFDKFEKSLRKFHSAEELPLEIWDQKRIESYNDPQFFYRQKPIIAKQLIKDYEVVIGADVDQIITGSLNDLWEDSSFDFAAPLNFNRIDPTIGQVVGLDLRGQFIAPPNYYFNCGLVVMRNKHFIQKWWELCFSPIFNIMQYREQDLMNYLILFSDYKFKNLDSGDGWFGLINKGEMPRFELKDNKLICPAGDDGFPSKTMDIKVIHFAGGNLPFDKFQYYRLHCTPEVIDYLDGLIT